MTPHFKRFYLVVLLMVFSMASPRFTTVVALSCLLFISSVNMHNHIIDLPSYVVNILQHISTKHFRDKDSQFQLL